MNIIRALPVLVLYFLATSFSHAALTPIGPLDFSSGVTVLDFSALADNTEANGLIVDGVLFQATKNGSSTNGVLIVGWRTRDNRKHYATELGLAVRSKCYCLDCFAAESRNPVRLWIPPLMPRFLSQSLLPSNFLPARHRSVAFPLRGFPIRSSPGVMRALLVIRHSIVRS